MMVPDIILKLRQEVLDPECGPFDKYEVTHRELREIYNYLNYLEQLNAQRHNFLVSNNSAFDRIPAPATPAAAPQAEHKRAS